MHLEMVPHLCWLASDPSGVTSIGTMTAVVPLLVL